MNEPECIAPFRDWVKYHGAWIHPALRFVSDDSGMSVVTVEDLAADTPVLSCPFHLVITPQSAKAAMKGAFGDLLDTRLDYLNERQLVVTYILMHFLNHKTEYFKHGPYLKTLPGSSRLFTPLYFNPEETKLLGGSNVALETKRREEIWKRELNAAWPVFQRIFGAHLVFTGTYWEKVCTWITSRSFPSSLLSTNNPNTTSSDSVPVLLPVLDCMNHKRAHPVTWLTSTKLLPEALATGANENGPYINLVHHPTLEAGLQVFNNYGPKGNAEFLLGYGFTLPNNPSDTIFLSIPQGQLHEVGREAEGIIPIWNEVRERMGIRREDTNWRSVMDVAQGLSDMVLAKMDVHDVVEDDIDMEEVRPLVRGYINNYMDGQRDILQSMYDFCERMRSRAREEARAAGVDLAEDEFDAGDEEVYQEVA
ncbi:SET domain-containing protein [Dacryopinax primogenitus]|uniref:SET domain-containing protein n=1 Tax=Dacryopinax primogenitus (strain DJM 731) TaxID=1858805 RepID=M5GH08_DACPD|nr:SET domain-containing protein [Dacryopinax primogenitus]EJU06413.1 SET domain-containing protein [Dacryopinax primogenitus]